jgi:uncharacterized protein YndB with AHSA1/START domain
MKWIRRALAVIVALPVLGVAVLILAGFREGAGRNVAHQSIARPRAEVLRHLVEPDLLRRWAGATELEVLTPLPLRKGSRLRSVTVSRGQRIEVLSEVTALDRDQVAVAARTAEGSPAGFAQLVSYRLKDRDGGTDLSVTVDTQYKGLALGLLEPLITRAAQRELERRLAALKAQVEAPSPPPASADARPGD